MIMRRGSGCDRLRRRHIFIRHNHMRYQIDDDVPVRGTTAAVLELRVLADLAVCGSCAKWGAATHPYRQSKSLGCRSTRAFIELIQQTIRIVSSIPIRGSNHLQPTDQVGRNATREDARSARSATIAFLIGIVILKHWLLDIKTGAAGRSWTQCRGQVRWEVPQHCGLIRTILHRL